MLTIVALPPYHVGEARCCKLQTRCILALRVVPGGLWVSPHLMDERTRFFNAESRFVNAMGKTRVKFRSHWLHFFSCPGFFPPPDVC